MMPRRGTEAVITAPTRNRLGADAPRGFESHPLRHFQSRLRKPFSHSPQQEIGSSLVRCAERLHCGTLPFSDQSLLYSALKLLEWRLFCLHARIMTRTPEAQACERIDELLEAAGWVIQDHAAFDRRAAPGVAVREYPLASGPCDYLLFVDARAAGVIEAKAAGTTLSMVAEQSARYATGARDYLARWADPLPFAYEATSEEIRFRDARDPKPRSRRVFAFHRPETLHRWLEQDVTLRGRLQQLPPLETRGLRDCQIEAINGLQAALEAFAVEGELPTK